MHMYMHMYMCMYVECMMILCEFSILRAIRANLGTAAPWEWHTPIPMPHGAPPAHGRAARRPRRGSGVQG